MFSLQETVINTAGSWTIVASEGVRCSHAALPDALMGRQLCADLSTGARDSLDRSFLLCRGTVVLDHVEAAPHPELVLPI